MATYELSSSSSSSCTSNDDDATDLSHYKEKRKSSELEADDAESEEQPVKKQKINFQFGKSFSFGATPDEAKDDKKKNSAPITLKLGAQQKPKESGSIVKPSSAAIAQAFNSEDEEEEEMPPEAKMRMRNIGRDTPTSAGPNSFGKTRQGFCDVKKMFEKQIKKKMEDVSQ